MGGHVMDNPDLHALANAPGFGKAKDAVKASGQWNHDYDEHGQPTPEWRVEVEAKATVRLTMTVRAADAETAMRLAREDASEEHDEDWMADADTLSGIRATIVSAPDDPPKQDAAA